MTGTIGRDELERMVAGAAAQIRERASWLSELDSISGDGDHGSTMLRTVERLQQSFAPGGSAELKTLLHDAGWNVLGVDGGASSSLIGSFFLGMAESDAVAGPLGCRELAAVFESGLAAVRKQTKAQPGDKTMIDALVPAVESIRLAAESGEGIVNALRAGADAARTGAEGTKDFIARYGRAKFLGERTRGYPDPGAISVALMFDGFWRGLAEAKGEAVNG